MPIKLILSPGRVSIFFKNKAIFIKICRDIVARKNLRRPRNTDFLLNILPIGNTLLTLFLGAIAQLGEHLLCKQEVVGSIPTSSTQNIKKS